jgi:hypothetical protein
MQGYINAAQYAAALSNTEPTPQRQPSVDSAVALVADRTNYTSELIATLSQRLSSVLRSCPPSGNASVGKVEAAPACELDARLRDIGANGSLNNEALLNILDRLEV